MSLPPLSHGPPNPDLWTRLSGPYERGALVLRPVEWLLHGVRMQWIADGVSCKESNTWQDATKAVHARESTLNFQPSFGTPLRYCQCLEKACHDVVTHSLDTTWAGVVSDSPRWDSDGCSLSNFYCFNITRTETVRGICGVGRRVRHNTHCMLCFHSTTILYVFCI